MTDRTQIFEAQTGQIYMIPLLEDNYAYIVKAKDTVVLVDPGASLPFLECIDRFALKPEAILVTHGDYDHYDGIPDLVSRYNIPVWVPENSNRAGQIIDPTQRLQVKNLSFEVFTTPGHRNHDLSFYCEEMGVAFCGDALFPGGCGRVNSGHPEWLWQSLQKIQSLPDQTALFCGHEYSLANYQFALNELPHNTLLKNRMAYLQKKLRQGEFSMPTSVQEEKDSNIFLRCGDPEWRNQLGLSECTAEEAFILVRQRKNNF